MNHSYSTTSSIQNAVSLEAETNVDTYTTLRGSWLVLARVGWGTLVTLNVGLFLVSLPGYYYRFLTLSSSVINDPTVVRASLAHLSLSANFFASYSFAIALILVLASYMVAGIIVWRKSNDWIVLLVAYLLVQYGEMFSFPNTFVNWGYTLVVDHSNLFWVVAIVFSTWVLVGMSFWLLFPDGRYVPSWMNWLMLLLVPYSGLNAVNALHFIYPYQFDFLVGACLSTIMTIIQIYRYRYVSNLIQRQQTKWVIVFAVSTVMVWMGYSGATIVFPTFVQDAWLYDLVLPPLCTLIVGLFPVAIGIAVLRYKLFAIDIIINRVFVWGTLSASILCICALIIGFLNWILNTGNNNIATSTLAATIAVAVILPLYKWLQENVDRLLHGKRHESLKLLEQLNKNMEEMKSDAVLTLIAQKVAQALKLSYAEIVISNSYNSSNIAISGSPVDEPIVIPLIYQTKTVGELRLAPATSSKKFTPTDNEFLDYLKSEIALIIHNVYLTDELQNARQHLANAREEERFRLRRDLHDGLGPTLSTIMHKVGLMRMPLYRCNPESTDMLLNQLEDEIELVIRDIKRIVYNLRPPELDELGLIGAIRAFTARLDTEAQAHNTAFIVTIEVPEPLPLHSAAVEVAAYCIVMEAMTNVMHHAQSQSCYLCLLLMEDVLHIEVSDNGKGIEKAHRVGIGLTSMRERAEELGGTFVLDKVDPCGTKITVRLPLLDNTRQVQA